jgi:1-acyl-sn-glycerol-3-phosphate acyltransferase
MQLKFYRKKGWLYKLIWPVSHYILIHVSVTVGYLFFNLVNRTVVRGRKNLPRAANTLLLSNHQSMIDSFLVGICAYYPLSFLKPSIIPWNPAAEENFFNNPIIAFLSDNWKCIPIKKGRKDVGAIYRMAEALRKSPMILFPEGTRSRNGVIGKPRAGAGLLILETQPTVIPVCIDGMDRILPIGSVIPRIFKKIYVFYGKPIDYSRYCNMEKTKEVAQSMMTEVMDSVRSLKAEIEAMKNRKVDFARESKEAVMRSKNYKRQRAVN